MPERLRLALIGCGQFAQNFSGYLVEEANLVALCDADVAKAAALARHRGLDIPLYDDHRQLLREIKPDAVAITTPNHLHADVAVDAANAGVHVFCEKPMARTAAECWQMVRACKQNNVKLMIGHKRRLRPAWARMIELTRSEGPLGRPLTISVSSHCDLRPYQMAGTWWSDRALCGGFFHRHGVHVIDWFAAMCGSAESVTARYGPQADPSYRMPDIVHATFAFRSGAVASINSAVAFPLRQFRESEGPMGQCEHGGFMLVPQLDHIDLYWQRLDAKDRHQERFDDLGFKHAFSREVSDFLQWVKADRPPCLTWVEGLRCVEMMEAAYRSADGGGTPVPLPLHPELEVEQQQIT